GKPAGPAPPVAAGAGPSEPGRPAEGVAAVARPPEPPADARWGGADRPPPRRAPVAAGPAESFKPAPELKPRLQHHPKAPVAGGGPGRRRGEGGGRRPDHPPSREADRLGRAKRAARRRHSGEGEMKEEGGPFPMRQAAGEIAVKTKGRRLYEITREVEGWTRSAGIETGLLTLYIQHTSASLLIQENADPEVLRDLERFFDRLIPQGDPLFRHTTEGPDDMPAHVRSALTATSLSIPVRQGRPALGTWQGIFLYEHRTAAHSRTVLAHLIGA